MVLYGAHYDIKCHEVQHKVAFGRSRLSGQASNPTPPPISEGLLWDSIVVRAMDKRWIVKVKGHFDDLALPIMVRTNIYLEGDGSSMTYDLPVIRVLQRRYSV